MISQAPVAFITVCVLTSALVYLWLRWQYGDLLKNKNALIDTLQKRLDLQMVAATPSHIEAPAPVKALVETASPKTHKLQFLTPQIIDALQDNDQIYCKGKETGHDLRLAVVEISNTLSAPELPVTSVPSVRAQLFYREISGPHRFDVRLGAWVGTDLTYYDFGVGSSRLVIVAGQDVMGTAAIENDYMEDDETYDPKTRELTGKSYEVIVQLMSGTARDSELVGQFTFGLTTKPLSLRATSDLAR